MSHTKYVMAENGTFAIISKMTGVEHYVLASYAGGLTQITTAGFLYLDPQDNMQSYGKSYSTGKSSSEEDGPEILAAINRGEVFIVENYEAGFFYATNNTDRRQPDSKVATLDSLYEHRIFESED
jgi:hypothetical protein